MTEVTPRPPIRAYLETEDIGTSPKMLRRGCGMTTLMEIAAFLQGTAGRSSLAAVVDCLVRALDVPFAFVAEIRDARSAHVHAFSGPSEHGFPSAFTLAGTPCALVLEQGSAAYASGVGRRFPADAGFGRLGVESFAGRVLRDADASPIGLIAAMGTAPFVWTPEAEALLAILALCAEAELRRIRGERKISLVARQWTATVDTIPDLVAVIAPDHRLLRVNLALARFASCPPRDLLGRKCHQVLHALDHPWPGCPHEEVMRTGRGVAIEVNDPHVGLPLCVTCTPFYDDGGVLVGTVHVARDISEQKQAAQVRERLIGELQETLSKAKILSGFLSICAACKKIRNDKGRWEQVEVYVRDRTDAKFSHGICPECARELYPAHHR